MTTTENLRREARVDAKIKVVIVRGRRQFPLETSDVSFKGLFLKTSEPPPIRSLLRLRVSLPLREIEAHAMAVHVATEEDVKEAAAEGASVATQRGAGVGVQFWGLAGPDRVAWDDFVRDLIQKKRAATKKPSGRMQATKAASTTTPADPNQSGTRIATSDPGSKKTSKR